MFCFDTFRLLATKVDRGEDVAEAVELMFETYVDLLPRPFEPLILLANLRAGTPGPGGQVTDFRVITAVVGALKRRGFTSIALADGVSPSAGPGPLERCRADRLALQLGIKLLDLAQGPVESVALRGGRFRISSAARHGRVICLPTVAVDRSVGLAATLTTLMGAVHPADRGRLMEAPEANLPDLARAVSPELIVAGALVVREGYDPPEDLAPRQVGVLAACPDPLLTDLFLGRILGMTPEEIPPLWAAIEGGLIDPAVFAALEEEVGILTSVAKPLPPWRDGARPGLETPPKKKRRLPPLRGLAAPAEPVADTLAQLRRRAERCGTCRRCEAFCPTQLKREDIGAADTHPNCMECLYCFMVCPNEALSIGGEAGSLAAFIDTEKPRLEQL